MNWIIKIASVPKKLKVEDVSANLIAHVCELEIAKDESITWIFVSITAKRLIKLFPLLSTIIFISLLMSSRTRETSFFNTARSFEVSNQNTLLIDFKSKLKCHICSRCKGRRRTHYGNGIDISSRRNLHDLSEISISDIHSV